MKKFFLLFLLFLLPLSYKAYPQEDLSQLRAIVHLSSDVSEGKYTLYQIGQTAKENNIAIVIPTDRDLMRWEYGLWPMRNLIKKKVEAKSIFQYGIRRYLKEIEELQNKFPEVIFIPGIEFFNHFIHGKHCV